jgi:hypothetical protein
MTTKRITPTQTDLVFSGLLRFYEPLETRLKLLEMINSGTAAIPLRDIDYFVTNYSKNHHIVANTSLKSNIRVYWEYKLNLKAAGSKRRFDPCCRWERVYIPHTPEGTFIRSTVGQLNFFRWIIETGLMEYIVAHHAEIKQELKASLRKTAKHGDDADTVSTTTTTMEVTEPKTKNKNKNKSVRKSTRPPAQEPTVLVTSIAPDLTQDLTQEQDEDQYEDLDSTQEEPEPNSEYINQE